MPQLTAPVAADDALDFLRPVGRPVATRSAVKWMVGSSQFMTWFNAQIKLVGRYDLVFTLAGSLRK